MVPAARPGETYWEDRLVDRAYSRYHLPKLMSYGIGLLVVVIAFCLVPDASAQSVADTVVVLEGIEVEAARAHEIEDLAPFSVFTFERLPEATSRESAFTLQDIAGGVPGLWIAGRGHMAIGERIVLRGASARSAFGTRGIQIIYDGIPITAPDGQAMTEIIDPAFVGRVEVMRGPGASIWGNASAGALYFGSMRGEERFHGRFESGSVGDIYAGARSAYLGQEWRTGAFVSHQRLEGYREHSGGNVSRAAFSSGRSFGDNTLLRVTAAGVYQDVRSPGSLTLAEFESDRTAANPSYVTHRAGKESTHGQVGIFLTHGTGASAIDATAYAITREVLNPLNYAIIDLSRTVAGSRVGYTYHGERLRLASGVNVAVQSDGRLNFANNEGERGDAPTFDQQEQVLTGALDAYATFAATPSVHLSAGARLDRLRFSMDDNLGLADASSGERTFNAFSPSFGVSWLPRRVLYYASVASSFETPTTTELVNRPDGTTGFNQELRPERTWSLEVGARGNAGSAATFDVSAFGMQISDRMMPFQTEAGGDRQFFRNVDEAYTLGAEVFSEITPTAWLELQASYAYIHARFIDTDDEHRFLPGLPQHQARVVIHLLLDEWRVSAQADLASSFFADDANSVDVDGFAVVDLTLSHRGFPVRQASVLPFLRVANVLDTAYSRSIIVNASFNRYYEPSPGRALQIGVSLLM